MKKILILFLLILPALVTNSCLFSNNCVECDIYNSYGNYVEYYGSECGNSIKTGNFEDDAYEYAVDYYDGWASCYER